jgi:hydroxymethylglutaryl-CoA lyase
MPIKYHLFDVSLRDGLQTINKENQHLITLFNKKEIYNKIVETYNPKYIEIGSIVSPKLLPIMSDSLDLLKSVSHHSNKPPYLLVPSLNKMKTLEFVQTPFNISLISSVSNSFQLKNINKSLAETKEEIENIIQFIKSMKKNIHIKLYISCVCHCPIEGFINPEQIANEILYYYNKHKMISNICLSDTCGSLDFENFKEIVDICLYKYFIPAKRLSLHLHINPDNMNNIQKIFNYSMNTGICKFDVSIFNDLGGCSMTMNHPYPNMDYVIFYKLLENYSIAKEIL